MVNNRFIESSYFKEELICSILGIPDQKAPIGRLLYADVSPEIISTRINETRKGRAYEGQSLTGVQLVVEVNLKGQIFYSAESTYHTKHIISYDTLTSLNIILPEQVGDRTIYEVYRMGGIAPRVEVEDVTVRLLDATTLQRCVLLFASVEISQEGENEIRK